MMKELNLVEVDTGGKEYSVWNNFKLKNGMWFGYDENDRPCSTKLYIFDDKVKFLVKDNNGNILERFIDITSNLLPLRIRQMLYVKHFSYLKKKDLVG